MSTGWIEVSTEDTSSHLVVRIHGELDLATAPVVRTALDDAVRAAGGRHVVLDLTGLAFLGSPGLGLLVGAWGRHTGGGAPFTVVAPSGGAPRRVLEITGLTGSISVVEVMSEAVDAEDRTGAPGEPGGWDGRTTTGG